MKRVFAALMVMEALLLSLASYHGLVMNTGASALTHVTSGFLTAIYHMFVHCLVMFYLIGAGKDIKKAVEDYPELYEEFVPATRILKKRVFPVGTYAILTILIAAFAGAYVHSELLASGHAVGTPQESLPAGATAQPGGELRIPGARTRTPEDPLPVRAIGLWWIHLALLLPALAVNLFAFVVEAAAIRDNVAIIRKLNVRLDEARRGGDSSGVA